MYVEKVKNDHHLNEYNGQRDKYSVIGTNNRIYSLKLIGNISEKIRMNLCNTDIVMTTITPQVDGYDVENETTQANRTARINKQLP